MGVGGVFRPFTFNVNIDVVVFKSKLTVCFLFFQCVLYSPFLLVFWIFKNSSTLIFCGIISQISVVLF